MTTAKPEMDHPGAAEETLMHINSASLTGSEEADLSFKISS